MHCVASPIRVLIDGFYLAKPRGLGRYVRELLHALAEHQNPLVGIEVLVPRTLAVADRVGEGRLVFHDGPPVPFPLWEQVVLPWSARRLGVDVLHCTYNTGALTWHGSSQVVTLHDLMFLDSDHEVVTTYQSIGRWYRAAVVPRLLRRHPTIVAVTRATADDLMRRFTVSATVVHTSLDLFHKQVYAQAAASPLDGPYMLHVGGTTPHKNSAACVQAFLDAAKPPWRLVVCGVPADAPLAAQYRGDQVLFPGWISETDLYNYYAHAVAVLFPSLSEGFGLPIIEAFGLGVPVLTSDREPMQSLAGRAALLVDPGNRLALTNGIHRLITDEALRADLSAAGRQRYKDFSPSAMTQAMHQIYQAAAASVE